MKKLYSGAVIAFRENEQGGTVYQMQATVTLAIDESEATANFERWGKQEFPQAIGWRDHAVCVYSIPNDFIRRAGFVMQL